MTALRTSSSLLVISQVRRPRSTRDTLEAVWYRVDHVWTRHHRSCDVIYHYVTYHGYHQIRHSYIWLQSKSNVKCSEQVCSKRTHHVWGRVVIKDTTYLMNITDKILLALKFELTEILS